MLLEYDPNKQYQINKALNLYRQGYTLKAIGERLNRSPDGIKYWIERIINKKTWRDFRKLKGRNNMSKLRKFIPEWKKLREEGLVYREIAEKYNCHFSTVAQYLKEKKNDVM